MTDTNNQSDENNTISSIKASKLLSEKNVGFTACYEVETYKYFYYGIHKTQFELNVKINSVTTTKGSNIVSKTSDYTGIMVWPATHLLSQFVLSALQATSNNATIGNNIIELGCGCGLVGATVGSLIRENNEYQKDLKITWVSTDTDDIVLQMCKDNFILNGIPVHGNINNTTFSVKRLHWGNIEQGTQLLQYIRQIRQQCNQEEVKYDTVVAADIVYPSTCGEILDDLFISINQLLKQKGKFVLSFCTRDGYKTPQRLIEASTNACFIISNIPMNEFLSKETMNKLPPLLDSKVLIFERVSCIDIARKHNKLIGGMECLIFPGLQASTQDYNDSSDEEWDAPLETDIFD